MVRSYFLPDEYPRPNFKSSMVSTCLEMQHKRKQVQVVKWC